MITEVRSQFVNINQQQVRGYDLLVRYENELPFGSWVSEAKATYTIEDVVILFDSSAASGQSRTDQVGSIGRPKVVANWRNSFERGDWTFTWFMRYVDDTENLDLDRENSYFGFQNAVYDIRADARLYHTVSVNYEQPDWEVLVGVSNLFDEAPPTVSSGVATRYGNVPAFATQYDLLGRSVFANFTYKF